MTIQAPVPLTAEHDLSTFACGETSLDEWLRRRALSNQVNGGSRTYVACEGDAVVGYYALSSGEVSHAEATSSIRRNMPNPVPVILLGRLAVDTRHRGQNVGTGLLQDALLRIEQAAQQVGVRGVLVDALNEEARRFYERWGFRPSPVSPLKLMITITELRRIIGEAVRP